MTNKAKSLEQRIADWEAGTLRGRSDEALIIYYQEFVSNLIADRQHLIDGNDSLRKLLDGCKASRTEQVQKLTEENKRLIERNEKLRTMCEDGIEREKGNLKEARRIMCSNTVGAGQALGAADTWREVLDLLNSKDGE